MAPERAAVAEADAARKFWAGEWSGPSFMAIGADDPDVATMHTLRGQIRGCPEPLLLAGAGHFVQEYGESVARATLQSFGDLSTRRSTAYIGRPHPPVPLY